MPAHLGDRILANAPTGRAGYWVGLLGGRKRLRAKAMPEAVLR